ncbi:MAG: glycosyltransferase [Anaerolineae bacterium]|nr:glycosyltransferase [Anaerolineae bacterium]
MTKPLKVLHLIDSLDAGGAQEIVASIIKYAHSKTFVHHCAALHGPGIVGEELKATGTPVAYLSNHRYRVITSLVHSFKVKRQIQPDIINLHLEFSTLLGLFLKNKSIRSKYVVSMHALKEQLPVWFYPLLKPVIKRANGIVVEDQIAKKQITQLGYHPSNISHIPIGTDYAERLKAQKGCLTGIRREFGISADSPIILNIARLHPAKGQTQLLRAFRQVQDHLPQSRLIIVGRGQEERILRNLVSQLNLDNSVIFAGLRRDLENFYTDADLFVMTALDENMGVVIYQAMAMGLPVVAYDAGSIAEIVEHNQTGFLTPCGDVDALAGQLITISKDLASYRQIIGAVARKRIETEFSAETMVRRYENFYLELVRH